MKEPWKLTRNQELNIMHVKDARQFVGSTPHRVVPGDTLVFDFVFFLHPVRGRTGSSSSSCVLVVLLTLLTH